MTDYVYRRTPIEGTAPANFVVQLQGGRLFVSDESGVLRASTDWAMFVGLLRAQLDQKGRRPA